MKTVLSGQNTAHNQITSEPSLSQAPSPVDSPPDKHILVLDGARALACLGVLVFHLNNEASNLQIWKPLTSIHDASSMLAYLAATLGDAGYSGIILFFLLSGFLLFLPYAKALLFESPWPSFRRFYLRRFFRILPAYYVTIFLMIFFFHPEFLHANHWHDIWLLMTFNISYQLSIQIDGTFWTLPIEFQFYLLLPIIVWFFSLIVRRGTLHRRMFKLTLCLLAMIAWGLITRYWGLYIASTSKLDFLIPHTFFQRLMPFIYGEAGRTINNGKYFEVFAIGMLIGMIYTYTRYAVFTESWRIRMRRFSPLMFITGLALIFFVSIWYFYSYHYAAGNINRNFFPTSPKLHIFLVALTSIVVRYWPEWHALVYALGYGLCMMAVLYGSPKFKRPFESSLLRWVASISFSLYLWHANFLNLFVIPLINLRRQSWGPFVQYGVFWCWTLVVIVSASAMLYRWIEQPGIRLGERLIRRLER